MTSLNTTVLRAIRAARAACASEGPFVVAIDGRSGAGKSTLAASLAKDLGAPLIEGDDFFAGGVTVRADPPEVLAAGCIDWRDEARVLKDLKAGRTARYAPFDWEAFDGSRAPEVSIEPTDIILLEGVYSARAELSDLIDFAILIETDPDERLRRLIAREGEIGPWEAQWHRAEDWYFAQDATPDRFDLVLKN